jgi:hypothetical protein
LLGRGDVKEINRIGGSARNNPNSKTKGYNRGQSDPAEFTELHALPSSWPNLRMEQAAARSRAMDKSLLGPLAL